MNINSGIPSDTLPIICLVAVLELKQRITTFFNRIFEINVEFRNMNALSLTSLLLFGSEKQTFDIKTKILNLTIQF